jgi:acyl-CoA reductase-like NAD-dependent aldehyde dehydrogenase
VIGTIVEETGKTYEDAAVVELGYGAGALGFWAKHAPEYLSDEKIRTSNPFVMGRKLVVCYRPVGVVGVIGPWNYPLTNNFGDAIPALAAGNAVVLKPSQVTPLTSLLLAEGIRECGLPEDAIQVVIGGAEAATVLIDAVDFVMFTGSTATGKKVMARAAETVTPVGLELGGKDPMIVLADANLERAANAATYYSMQNGGQTCVSVERVYVEAPIYDRFVDAVTERVKALRVGAPNGPASVEVGAITFGPQLDTVAMHVEQAREAGARVTAGGRVREGAGRFYEPTVLADVDQSMTAMQEETFGPTLPIMKVADADEAIRLANDSPYGLGASVWTKDRARGEEVARRLESGYACVNDANVNYFAYELPMGGWKESGLGVRHGAAGIRKYTRQQAILVARLQPRREPHYFPYRAGTTRLLGRLVKLLYGRGSRS